MYLQLWKIGVSGWTAMIVPHATFRWIMTGYLAVLLPVCCCYTSALAGPNAPPHDHAEHVNDHGHHGAVVAGNHHEPHDLQGQQAPPGPNHPCDPESHDHGGECDCGCSSGPDVFTPGAPGASVASDLTINSEVAVVGVIDPAPLRRTAIISTPATRHKACTSLLQLHCALIV